MSTIAVFLVLGGATAFAALGNHGVGARQLKKNAVTTAKIRKMAVTTAKIRNHAVTAAKLDLSSLGPVPSAATAQQAADAMSVNGQALVKVFDSVAAGQTKDVAAVGGF